MNEVVMHWNDGPSFISFAYLIAVVVDHVPGDVFSTFHLSMHH